MTPVEIITPEFEINIKEQGEKTVYRIIDIPQSKIIYEKILDEPYLEVMDKVRTKLMEVV